MINILVFLVIGLISGWLAGKLRFGQGLGLLNNLIIGVAGALFGGFLFRFIGVATRGFFADVIAAIIGAWILLYVLGRIKSERKAS